MRITVPPRRPTATDAARRSARAAAIASGPVPRGVPPVAPLS